MRTETHRRLLLAALAGGGVALGAGSARAVNPLEYPDNGSASFSRGGAWLAVANEPIATHYNPAGLATQPSGFSLEQQLNFNHVCYDRHGPNGAKEGPSGDLTPESPGVEYVPVCNGRASFPSAIPSMAIAVRLTDKLGFGVAVVPPAAYGTPDNAYAPLRQGYDRAMAECLAALPAGYTPEQARRCGGTNPNYKIPAPYRYMQLDQHSLILFPTVGVGYEAFKGFRIGAAFISGIAVINTQSVGVTTEGPGITADHAGDDTISELRTRDLFVPGIIVSALWSVTDRIDVAAWGRWISDVYSEQGELDVDTHSYADRDPVTGAPPYSRLSPHCRQVNPLDCVDTAIPHHYEGKDFRHFRFPYPPEARVGVRYHHPRSQIRADRAGTFSVGAGAGDVAVNRDPLHDDVFDVELDGSYTWNSKAQTIQARFIDENGAGAAIVDPGFVPPNADRWNGYKDSYGFRLGGQVNVVPDKLGIRAGTWYESQSQEAKWLNIGVVGAARGGFGGGVVFRQNFIDISLGYQRHWSSGLDNGGRGGMRAAMGQLSGAQGFNLHNDPPDVTAAERTQFRSGRTINDGRMTQSAHAFTLGGTVRF